MSLAAGSPAKHDYEYVRNGTTNLFVAVEPKGGQRIVSVTERRGKVDFLHVLHEVSKERRLLLIGAEAWPVPVPIVRVGERWRFASEEGADELVNRRIGANERNAIYALRAYLDAQRAFAARDRDGDGVREYATRISSTPGAV